MTERVKVVVAFEIDAQEVRDYWVWPYDRPVTETLMDKLDSYVVFSHRNPSPIAATLLSTTEDPA